MRALVISGGGNKGAYAGGAAEFLINGCGRDYSLILGTSTGSLLSPLQAIGGVEKLKKAFTNITQHDVFKVCPFRIKKRETGYRISINHFGIVRMFLSVKKTFGDSGNLKEVIRTSFTESDFEKKKFNRIAIAVDYSQMDKATLDYAFSVGNEATQYLLIHVVESAGAILLGDEIQDKESADDEERLNFYAAELQARGIKVETYLGFGNPKLNIPSAVRNFEADLLVLGAHGHRFFKDLIFGTTVDSVRHRVAIPVFIVRA